MKSSAAVPLVVAGYLYLNLFLLPGTPILLNGDQVFFWMDGQRILAGELPYRDFFQFTAPGTDLFYWATFKIFGTRIWVLNGIVLLLGVVLSGIGFSVAARIMDRKRVLLATFLFATLIYSKVLNATHHWFSLFAIMNCDCGTTAGLVGDETGRCRCAIGNRRLLHTNARVRVPGWHLSVSEEKHGPESIVAKSWKNERLLLLGFAVTLFSLNA